MRLYEEAVDLALTVDIELAKQIADLPEQLYEFGGGSGGSGDVGSSSGGGGGSSSSDDGSRAESEQEELRKKLWLRIARHVVEEEKDIKKAMAVLQHTSKLLKIEDILPFFPDFVKIDDFKDEICSSLEEYNKHISDLKREMGEATESADNIRKDIKELRNKYGFVSGNQPCDMCGFPVLTRSFYLFPCQHVFHFSCLIDEMMKHLDPTKQKRIIELQNKLKELEFGFSTKTNNNIRNATHSEDQPEHVVSESDQLKEELDKFIASECILCGDIIIKSIFKPFINADDIEQIASWQL